MKVLRAEVSVECDDGVTHEMITALLINQMYFAFDETQGGVIRWDKMRVRPIVELAE